MDSDITFEIQQISQIIFQRIFIEISFYTFIHFCIRTYHMENASEKLSRPKSVE